MPRLVHVSDTHLGFQAYSRLTTDGLNQREVDFQDAFARVVDAAVADPPDLFLHTGDLFDHPRPTNRAIAHALHQVRRLADRKVPTVLVSGNHDAPRMRETGSIFRVFEDLPGVHAVYRGQLETIQAGGMTVHAVSQAITQEAFHAQLAAAKPEGPGPHVLAVHGTVLGVDGLFTSEFNEYQIPANAIRPDFDYIALGHFHNAKRVADNAWYAGSAEYCSFAEADEPKVWLDAQVDRGQAKVRHRETGARPMKDLGVVDATGLDRDRLMEALRVAVGNAPKASVARLTVERLERALARTLDWEGVRALRPDLCHLELRPRVLEEVGASEAGLELAGIAREFESFLGRYPLPDGLRDEIRTEAMACLADAQAGGDGAA